VSAPAPAIIAGVPDAKPVPFLLTATGAVIANGDWLLAGWTMIENTGAAVAMIELFGGTDATGVSLGKRSFAANESITDQLPWVHCETGIFATVSAGTVKGTLYPAKV